MNKIEMWEILVPTTRNDGRPIRTRFHRVWDKKVYEITGGMTICTPVHGRWISDANDGEELFSERMIPVRIACTREQLDQILPMTQEYYEQLAIMAYKISEEVIIFDARKDE